MLIINHTIEILVETESQSMRLYREYSPLRWLNTVLAVCEHMSFAKSRQEKGFSSQAETWQVKNLQMKDYDWQVKFDVFVVSMAR